MHRGCGKPEIKRALGQNRIVKGCGRRQDLHPVKTIEITRLSGEAVNHVEDRVVIVARLIGVDDLDITLRETLADSRDRIADHVE